MSASMAWATPCRGTTAASGGSSVRPVKADRDLSPAAGQSFVDHRDRTARLRRLRPGEGTEADDISGMQPLASCAEVSCEPDDGVEGVTQNIAARRPREFTALIVESRDRHSRPGIEEVRGRLDRDR